MFGSLPISVKKIQSEQMYGSEKVVLVGLGLIHHFLLYTGAQTLTGYRSVSVEEHSWNVSADYNVTSLTDRGPV